MIFSIFGLSGPRGLPSSPTAAYPVPLFSHRDQCIFILRCRMRGHSSPHEMIKHDRSLRTFSISVFEQLLPPALLPPGRAPSEANKATACSSTSRDQGIARRGLVDSSVFAVIFSGPQINLRVDANASFQTHLLLYVQVSALSICLEHVEG